MTASDDRPFPDEPMFGGYAPSLTRRLIVGMAGILFFSYWLGMGISYKFLNDRALDRLADQADQYGRFLAVALEYPLWHYDAMAIKEVARTLLKDPRVLTVRVEDPIGRGFIPPGFESDSFIIFEGDKYSGPLLIERSRDVHHQKQLVGTFHFSMYPHFHLRFNQWLLPGGLALAALMVMVLILMARYLFGVYILKPLVGMTAVVSAYPEKSESPPHFEAPCLEFEGLAEAIRGFCRRLERMAGEIRRSEEAYRAIFDNAAEGIFLADFEKRRLLKLRKANASMAKIFGYDTPEEMLGFRNFLLYHANLKKDATALMDTLFRYRKVSGREIRLYRKDRERFWASVYIQPVPGSYGRMMGFIMDITQRRKLDESRRDEMMRNVEKEARVMLMQRLRTEMEPPLYVVAGIADLMFRKTDMSPTQVQYIEKLRASAGIVQHILKNMAQYAALLTGKYDLTEREVNIRAMLESVERYHRELSRSRNQPMEVTVAPDVPETLIGDRNNIETVFKRVMENAFRYRDSGPVEIHARVEYLMEEKLWLRFEVKDHGPGIKDMVEYDFFATPQPPLWSLESIYGPKGIGIRMARELVSKMGGEIWAKSSPAGTTIVFTIAFGLPPETTVEGYLPPAAPEGRPERPLGIESLRGAEVLLVEDNTINQQVATEILEKAGLAVFIARDGDEAVEAVLNRANLSGGGLFDAVLMDIRMPGTDGYEATGLIRQDARFENLPIIAMTADEDEEQQRRCREAGLNDRVVKPLDPDRLLETLARWIRGAEEERPAAVEITPAEGAEVAEAAEPAAQRPLPKDLPGIDVEAAMRELGGDRARFRSIIRDFIIDHFHTAQRIREALKGGDRKSARRLTHAVRGVSGILAGRWLYRAARDLAIAIDVAEERQVHRLLGVLESALEEALTSAGRLAPLLDLSEFREGLYGISSSIAPDRPVAALLHDLDLLLRHNSSRARGNFEESKPRLDQVGLPLETAQLERQIHRFDFKGARRTLAIIAENLEIPLDRG